MIGEIYLNSLKLLVPLCGFQYVDTAFHAELNERETNVVLQLEMLILIIITMALMKGSFSTDDVSFHNAMPLSRKLRQRIGNFKKIVFFNKY